MDHRAPVLAAGGSPGGKYRLYKEKAGTNGALYLAVGCPYDSDEFGCIEVPFLCKLFPYYEFFRHSPVLLDKERDPLFQGSCSRAGFGVCRKVLLFTLSLS